MKYIDFIDAIKIGVNDINLWHSSKAGKDCIAKLRFKIVALEAELRDSGILNLASFTYNLAYYFDSLLKNQEKNQDLTDADQQFILQCLQQLQYGLIEVSEGSKDVEIPEYLDIQLFKKRYAISDEDAISDEEAIADKTVEPIIGIAGATDQDDDSLASNSLSIESELIATILSEAKDSFPEIEQYVKQLKLHPSKLAAIDLIAYRLNNLKNIADLASLDYLYKILDKLEIFIVSYLTEPKVDPKFFNNFEVNYEQIKYAIQSLDTASKTSAQDAEALADSPAADNIDEKLQQNFIETNIEAEITKKPEKAELLTAKQRVTDFKSQKVEKLQLTAENYLSLINSSAKLLGRQPAMSARLNAIIDNVSQLGSPADSLSQLVAMLSNINDPDFEVNTFSTLLKSSQKQVALLQQNLYQNSQNLKQLFLNDTSQKRNINQQLSNFSSKTFKHYDEAIRKRVKMVAVAQNKNVCLHWVNQQQEFDHLLLSKLLPLLFIVIDNAIVHGIETAEQRKNSNKNQQAKITINILFTYEGYSIQITDDGAGLNTDKILSRAISKGIAANKSISSVSQSDLLDYIFDERFYEGSNKQDNLHTLNLKIKELGGELRFESISGRGTQIFMTLPTALSPTKTKYKGFRVN